MHPRTVTGEILSTKVTTAVAAREGVNPVELEKPLYDVVDVGALETVVEFAGRGPQREVEIRLLTTDTRSSPTRPAT